MDDTSAISTPGGRGCIVFGKGITVGISDFKQPEKNNDCKMCKNLGGVRISCKSVTFAR